MVQEAANPLSFAAGACSVADVNPKTWVARSFPKGCETLLLDWDVAIVETGFCSFGGLERGKTPDGYN